MALWVYILAVAFVSFLVLVVTGTLLACRRLEDERDEALARADEAEARAERAESERDGATFRAEQYRELFVKVRDRLERVGQNWRA